MMVCMNIILYVRTGCPYCAKVLEALKRLRVGCELRNIENPKVAEELIALGGKQQVPFLVDRERGVEMYESGDIIKYLDEYYKADDK